MDSTRWKRYYTLEKKNATTVNSIYAQAHSQ